ncbi:cytochrome P450 [Nocardia noduli]|uniref:cytochrome P450 n=1 Tax=Nocardia noduli TaxID=2815722 RepID=UPI0020B28635|nr:cytochrome P450 [Nocardia noduli]
MTSDVATPVCPRAYPFGQTHTVDLEPDYREGGPVSAVVLPSGAWGWLVTDHTLVRQVLADPRFSREQANQPQVARLSTEILPAAAILANDAPRHTVLRRRIAPMFAPARVAAMAPAITDLAHRLVDGLIERGQPADMVSDFIEPFAAAVVCEMFGVPADLRERVFTLGDALTAREATPQSLARARGECEELVRGLAARSPQVLVSLMRAEDDIDDEVVNLLIACLIGGRGSPTVFLSSALFTLLREPRHYRQLVEAPASIEAVVEELLRFVPVGVGGGFTRVATEDIGLGPVLVRAGDAVIPAMHAAGRDPQVFDDPDTLVLDRGPKLAHLAFGHGAHYCVGAGLARLQAQIALRTLTTRMPELRLADPADRGRWRVGRVVRSLEGLDVAWT